MYKLESKTVKGLSPLTINRTAENKMKVFPYGYTHQETRSGKNLVNVFETITTNSGFTLPDVSISKDGFVTYENTGGYRNALFNTFEAEPSTTYYSYLEVIEETKTPVVYLREFNENMEQLRVSYPKNQNFVTMSTTKYIQYGLTTDAYTSTGKFTARPMIVKTSSVDNVYEPYGVMPSPDYPSDIRNVGDNVQLFDKSTTTDGKYIGSDGSIQTQSDAMYSDYIEIKLNEDFYISGRTTWSSIALYDENKTFLERIATTKPNGVLNITNSDCKYIIFNALLTDKDTLKLEKGKTATSYSEYGCGSVGFKAQNKNICDNSKVGSFDIRGNGTYRIGIDLGVLQAGTYYLSRKDKNKTAALYLTQVIDGVYQDYETYGFEFAFTITEPCRCIIRSTDNLLDAWNRGVGELQIEKGEKTSYVEHQEQTVVFPFTEGQVLHKGDYLAEDGVHQQRKTIVLDGTKTLGLMSSSDTGRNLIYYSAELSDIKKDFTALKNCSHFEATKRAIENWENYNYESCSTNANNTIYFNTSMTLAELKTFLAEQYANGTPVTIEYELAEEIVIPYTEEQEYVLNHIYSYEETTNIDIISEFEIEIDVEYTPQFLQEIKDKFIKGPTFGRIHILETDENFTQDNYLKDFSVSELRFVPDKGLFGGCVAKKVDVNFNNVNKQFSIQDKEFEAYLGVDYEDERYEIKYGTFIVQHPETEDTTDNTSFTALDYMIKFNQKYIDYVTYPCTLRDIAESICIQAGVTLAEEKFRNDDFIVENNQFVNGENLRQVLQGIALSAFSWARVDENNELHFDLNQNEDIDIELTPNEYYNLSKDDYIYGPVNRIIIRDSQIEGENVTIDDEELQNYAIGKNKFDSKNASYYSRDTRETYIINSSNSITVSGTNMSWSRVTIRIKNLKPSTKYTMSAKVTNISNHNAGLLIEDDNNNVNSMSVNTNFTSKITFITDSNGSIVIQAFSNWSGTILSESVTFDDIQLEEGDIATEFEKFISSGVCELVIEDNPFAYTQEKREQLIEAGKELFGFRYMPINEVSLIGLAFLNSKDKIRFNTLDGDVFDTYLFDHTINYNGVILDNMQSKALTKTETKYIYKPDITQAIKNTQIIVDKANQTINQIIEKQDEQSSQLVNIETDLSGVHTTIQDNQKDIEEKINEIEQTIEGTRQTLTYKGGNNIFYYAKEFWNNGTEGGTANLEELTSDTEIQQKSVSGNAYIINKGTSEQKNIVKNDTYTISFTYKKLIDLATGYVDINGTIIDLTSTSWKEEVETIEIDTNTIDIKIVSDTANAFKIFDLMGAVGNEKQVWTQNPNETRTDTVTIGKGIQVNSSSKNTYTRLDADGTRIYNSDTGLPVTEFTQQGVDTDKITADVGQVGGILIQVIDGQTWFSSLL